MDSTDNVDDADAVWMWTLSSMLMSTFTTLMFNSLLWCVHILDDDDGNCNGMCM